MDPGNVQNPSFVDICLSPDGYCACAEKAKQGGIAEDFNAAPSQCWRVRVPWWAMSSQLLPLNFHEQLLRHDAGFTESGETMRNEFSTGSSRLPRSRTPSPERVAYPAMPAAIQFAPPKVPTESFFSFRRFSEDLVDLGASFSQAVLGRGPRQRNRGPRSNFPTPQPQSQAQALGKWQDDEWETGSQTSDAASLVSGSSASRRGRGNFPIYIGMHLHWLESKDPQCVFIVKKINKLGFGAADILERHFSQWGAVDKVLLSGVPLDGTAPQRVPGTRSRPSGLGWVVMRDPQVVARILSLSHHEVESVTIDVFEFKQRPEGQSSLQEETIWEVLVEEKNKDSWADISGV